MRYRDELIQGKVSKRIREKTRYYMDVCHIGLYDAFKEAAREHGKSREIRHAFFFDDYRKFIPAAYCPEFLDFKKYPLKYKL